MDGANQSTEGQRETSRSCVILQGSPETAKAMLQDSVASPLLVGCLVMPLFGAICRLPGDITKPSSRPMNIAVRRSSFLPRISQICIGKLPLGCCRVQAVRPALPY